MDSWIPLGLFSSAFLIACIIYSFLSAGSLAVLILGLFCIVSLLLKWGKIYDFISPSFWIACLLTTASDIEEVVLLTTAFVLYYPMGRIYANFSGSPSKLDVATKHILLALVVAIGGGALPLILIPIFMGFPITMEISISLTILIVLLFEFLRRSFAKSDIV